MTSKEDMREYYLYTSSHKNLKETLRHMAVGYSTNREDRDTAEYYLDEMVKWFTHYLAEAEREAYRNGYNDNARECNCDYLPVGHQHILDDGRSHNIRPELNKLKEVFDHE